MNGLYFGGVPTDIDVEKLNKTFVDLNAGDIVTYMQLEQCLGMSRELNRFRTIVGAWRRKLFRERNVFLGTVKNEGYRVCDASARVEQAAKGLTSARRKMSKAAAVAATTPTDGLSASEQKLIQHIVSVNAHYRLFESTSRRAITAADKLEALQIKRP